MKLLFISESFPTSIAADFTGGVEARDFYLTRELARHHQVTVITNARPDIKSRHRLGSVTVIRVGLPTSGRFRNNPLTRIIFIPCAILAARRLKFDLVHASNVFTAPTGYLISKLINTPSALTVHDVFLGSWFRHTDPLTAIIGELLERLVFKLNFTLFIANSHTTLAKLKPHLSSTANTVVIYGGVDRSLIRHLSVTKLPYAQIVFAGRLVKYKRVSDLIDALVLVKHKLPFIHLAIIGDGPEAKSLHRYAKSLGIHRHISFLGFVPSHQQVLTEIKRSTVLCLPSTVEGFGLVTLEALAAGIPYVNADIPATREITKGGLGGLLFKPQNPRSLATNLIKLLTDQDLYQHKQLEAKKLAAGYDWSIIGHTTSRNFQKLLPTKS